MMACYSGHSQVIQTLIDNKLVSSDGLQLKDNEDDSFDVCMWRGSFSRSPNSY